MRRRDEATRLVGGGAEGYFAETWEITSSGEYGGPPVVERDGLLGLDLELRDLDLDFGVVVDGSEFFLGLDLDFGRVC